MRRLFPYSRIDLIVQKSAALHNRKKADWSSFLALKEKKVPDH